MIDFSTLGLVLIANFIFFPKERKIVKNIFQII